MGEGEEVEILNDIFYKAKKLPQLKNGEKKERENEPRHQNHDRDTHRNS